VTGSGAHRSRLVIVIGLTGGAGVALMSATQVWLSGTLDLVGLPPVVVSLTGRTVAPLLPAVALLALGAAVGLLLVGGVARRVFGGVVALAGIGAAWSAATIASDPAGAVAGPLAQAAGLAAPPAGAALDPVRTGWPVIGIAGAVVITLAALGALLLRRWPEVGRRYATAAGAAREVVPPDQPPAGGAATSSRGEPRPVQKADGIGLWDAVERGDDPTL
jgi:uncharacterized membrane protein (TIGR02234 family)